MSNKETYGTALHRQLMGMDFLSQELSNDLKKNYLLPYIADLGISFFTLHYSHTINKKSALQTDKAYLVNGIERNTQTLKNDDGLARDQVSFVFLSKTPCWIVGNNQENLSKAKFYLDMWAESNLTDLPRYNKNADGDMKTSVIIPASAKYNSDAIVNFEFDEAVLPSSILKEELQEIARIAFTIRSRKSEWDKERKSTLEAFKIIQTDADNRTASNSILAALLATDIVNKDIFEAAKRKIEDRITALNIDFYIFHKACKISIGDEPEVGYTPSLVWKKGWRDNGTEHLGNSNPVYTDGEMVSSQVAYVFDSLTTAVIKGDKPTFSESDNFIDTLQNDKPVPNYTKNSKNQTMVSIICPSISDSSELYGVVNFEFSEHPDNIDEQFIHDLSNLARSIGRLQYLFDMTNDRMESSKQSIKNLQPFVDPRLKFKQQIFLAYPEKGDPQIIEKIEQAIHKLQVANKLQLKLLKWEDAKRTGAANQNLRDAIMKSQFVLGYLSEPLEGETHNYKDNINVMLELGAAYFCSGDKVLGIRETKTQEDIPFDLNDLQLVTIKRDEHGAIDKNLESQIAKLVAKALSLDFPVASKDIHPVEPD